MAQAAEQMIGHLRIEGQTFPFSTNHNSGIQRAICGPLIKVFPFGCKLLKAENHKRACAVPTKLKTAVMKLKKTNALIFKTVFLDLVPAAIAEVIKPISSIEIL